MADKKKKVLVVEDDALLLQVLGDKLLAEGYEILGVMNGLKVIAEVEKFNPDIILLDLILPGLDGFEVLKQLKEDTKTKNIPVAIISNLSEVSDVKSVRALGADEYFIKANTQLEKIVKYIKKKIHG